MRGGFVPGDVAALTLPGGEQARGVRNWRNDGWEHGGEFGAGSCYDDISREVAARPLVVIDPEDEATLRQVGDLLVAEDRGYDGDSWQDLQAALRSLIADPKPDEPQGLGAVVEDDRGVRWVRAESAKGIRNPWQATLHPSERDTVRQLAYADVKAVRVLSEGVS